jgi:hypothetical protein
MVATWDDGHGDGNVVGDGNVGMVAVAMPAAMAMWVGVKHLHTMINARCQSRQMLHPYGIVVPR